MEYRYYFPELDLDGTAEELFIQARNGYIEQPEALKKISEILRNPVENKEEKAKYVDILREIAEDKHDEPYVFAQYKKDILDGCGSEEVMLNDSLSLFVMRDREKVIIALNEPDETGYIKSGACMLEKDFFLNMTKADFKTTISSIYLYQME